MDVLESAFAHGGTNLEEFLARFRLEYTPFLQALQKAKAVATGADFVLFLAGLWADSLVERPRALILDLLVYGEKQKGYLLRFLAETGYGENVFRCPHNTGEWADLPRGKITCMVNGELSHRVVHVIEVPRPPAEVVLSRVYGSMAGNYLSGSGRVVSLFPYLTFVKHYCWYPIWATPKLASRLEYKYSGWSWAASRPGYSSSEVGAVTRSIDDTISWILQFGTDGDLVSSQRPDWPVYVYHLSLLRGILIRLHRSYEEEEVPDRREVGEQKA